MNFINHIGHNAQKSNEAQFCRPIALIDELIPIGYTPSIVKNGWGRLTKLVEFLAIIWDPFQLVLETEHGMVQWESLFCELVSFLNLTGDKDRERCINYFC